MAHTTRRLGAVAALGFAVTALVGCGSGDPEPAAMEVVHVPADAPLGQAGDLVADGGVIMIAPGTYTESLQVSADDVTVRGEDRSGVIIDGELTRSNGIVMTGERAVVENLTVRNFLQNGVLITGVTDENGAGVARGPDGYLPDDVPDPVPGYLVQYVTAQNNGLYGIYAFNRTGGEIINNLASGGSDSGIYVGQCADCGAAVTDNVLTLNAVGIELANASNVTITGNRITGNRIGMTVLSNYLEAHGPTTGVRIVGNVIAGNNEAATPVQANGAFGTGIGLSGTVDALVRANLIAGNRNAGVWISSSDDFAPTGTRVMDNVWADAAWAPDGGSGYAVVFAPSAAATGSDNCIAVSGSGAGSDSADAGGAGAAAKTLPAGLSPDDCDPAAADYRQPTAPDGVRFSDVALPPERPGLDEVDARPRSIGDTVELPDIDAVQVPAADLLEAAR